MNHKTTCTDDPSVEKSEELIRTGLEFDNLITISGLCAVDYDGRASSFFGYCDCFVLIKPDGTLLIHQNEGRKPTNWQPPGCEFNVGSQNNELIVVATRDKKDERIELRCPEVYNVQSYDIDEPVEKEIFGTEDQMQTRIMDNPEIIENGFEAVESEHSIDVGAIDIFGYDKNGEPVIIELKRRRAGPEAADQLKRYMDNYGLELSEDARGILVAPSFTQTTKDALAEGGLEYMTLEPETENQNSFSSPLECFN